MSARHVLIGLMLLAMVAAWPQVGAVAQEESADQTLDLAAMSLAPDDVPSGFFDEYSEQETPANWISALILAGEATPAGLERWRQTFYFNPEQASGIYVYLLEFASPAQAEAGAGIIEAALRPPLPEGTTIGPTFGPGPAVGEEPRTTTFVTYDTWEAGGPRVDAIAASFRRDGLVAGVSVERWVDPPAADATPVAPDSAQEQLAMSLATTLDGRITDVLAGIAPAGADLTLPGAVLPIDQLAGDPLPVLGGYTSGIDLLRCGICGEENSLVGFADAALGGFSRTVVVGPLVDGEPTPPFVSVAVSAFDSPEDALAVLEAIRQAPNDRPTPGPIPRGAKTLAADPAIPGSTSALAFHAAMDEEDPNAPIDSAGVDFVLGDWLVTVDVQGGLSADDAMAAAVDLASQQSACLTSSDPCDSVTRPPKLGNTD